MLPAQPTDAQNESIRRLRIKLSGQYDILVSEVRVKNTKGFGGLAYPLIPAKDVEGLYRRAHRARTAVIAFGATRVLLDIGKLPTTKGCISLERFIQYKCSYTLISRPEEVDKAWTKILAWMNDLYCEGPRDPRCFPTAIFEPQREYLLDTSKERQDFIRTHKQSKNSNALTDARGRIWQIGPEHTRELIQVAGRTLPIGFHWDVQGARNSTIATGWEVWYLPGRGYTNIHPDALIRGGNATKRYPKSGGVVKPKNPKTPRSPRHRKSR